MTVEGLPTHVLLNHFVIVLVPLTAILLIICALWSAARERLVWLVAALAALILVVTPVTVGTGRWFADRVDQTPELHTHVHAGQYATLLVAAPLFVAAALLGGLHVRQGRGSAVQPVLRWSVMVAVIGTAAWTMYEIHTIGESGARAAWGS